MERMDDTKARLLGVLLILGGIALGYYCYYLPMEEAKNHVEYIHSSMKGQFFAPPALILGLFMTILGNQGKELLFEEPKKLTLFGWIFTICTIGVSVGCSTWFDSATSGMGYK
jgi:hypothetical protein